MFFWAFFAYDSPKTHPRIAEKEKRYIQESLPDSDAKDQVQTRSPMPRNHSDFLRSHNFWPLSVY